MAEQKDEDIKLDRMFVAGKEIIENSYILSPQETLIFMTKKINPMDINQFGIIFEKLTVWKKGLLLNCPRYIGPGYPNELQGMIVNMSAHKCIISKDDLILTIKRVNNYDQKGDDSKKNVNVKDVRESSLKFPKSFLSVESTYDNFIEKVYPKINNKILLILSVIGALLAAYMFAIDYMALRKIDDFVSNYELLDNSNLKSDDRIKKINKDIYFKE